MSVSQSLASRGGHQPWYPDVSEAYVEGEVSGPGLEGLFQEGDLWGLRVNLGLQGLPYASLWPSPAMCLPPGTRKCWGLQG